MQVEQNSVSHPGQRVRNDRVIAIPDAYKRAAVDAGDFLADRVRDELAHFFLATTVFEGKDLQILGWDGPDAALYLIRHAAI